MKENTQFDIDHFLENDKFLAWINHGEHHEYWQTFLKENPHLNATIDEASFIVTSIKELDRPSQTSIEKWEVWQNIEDTILKETKRPYKIYGVAIGLILMVALLGAYSYYYIHNDSEIEVSTDPNERWVEYTNDSNTNWPIDLADGSQVILEPNAYLKYPLAFHQKTRKVQLKGDAFFDIAHDTLKPFFIYSNEAVIRVLGTSFYVKADEDDKDIEVIVKTGKVAVYRSKEIKEYQARKIEKVEPIVVTPNQVATLERANLVLNKRLVTTPTLVKPLNTIEKIHFEDRPIHEIIEALENAYGVEIELDANIYNTCRLTTTLTNQPLFEKLKIICDPLGLDYLEEDVKIYIKGTCNE